MSAVRSSVRKAVIPAAGKGTRFLPATKAIPKEMIPIVDIPMIQLIVEEAVRSGIQEIVLVTSIRKESIENHFDYNEELEAFLENKGKKELAELSRSIGRMAKIMTVRQQNPHGLGHAVSCAEALLGGEPFAVLLPDDLIDAQIPCTKQLIEIYDQFKAPVVAVMTVPQEEVSKYGIVAGKSIRAGLLEVQEMVEKPEAKDSISQLAMPGRYILNQGILDCLRFTLPGRQGEIQLTDALQAYAKKNQLLALEFEGVRYDSGDRLGYIDATLAYALKRKELASGVKKILEKHLKGGA